MKTVFLELAFDSQECRNSGIESRDEIEDDLEALFEKSQLGIVTGGGGGMGRYNIDVEIFDEDKLSEAISLIRAFLVSIKVPQNSKIIRHHPERKEIPIYE